MASFARRAGSQGRVRQEELGLFVTLGSFSKDALHIERTRQDLRLINSKELADLIFANYDALSPECKRMLPMRSVYVVDRGLDSP